MQAQQLIEELQPHNLPHLPNGDFIITSKQRDAIEYLLSQQAVVEQTDEEWACDYATGYFISPECYDAQKDAALAGCNHVRQQLSKQPQPTPEAMQSAAKEYADSQFAAPFDKLYSAGKKRWYAYFNGYLAGKSGNGNK